MKTQLCLDGIRHLVLPSSSCGSRRAWNRTSHAPHKKLGGRSLIKAPHESADSCAQSPTQKRRFCGSVDRASRPSVPSETKGIGLLTILGRSSMALVRNLGFLPMSIPVRLDSRVCSKSTPSDCMSQLELNRIRLLEHPSSRGSPIASSTSPDQQEVPYESRGRIANF